MHELHAARHAPEPNCVTDKSAERAYDGDFADPLRAIRRIDLQRRHRGPLVCKQFRELACLVGHPACRRRERPDDGEPETGQLQWAAGARRPNTSRYRSTLVGQFRSCST